MKAVLRIFFAWRRFFFFIGCNPLLHTVMLNHAELTGPCIRTRPSPIRILPPLVPIRVRVWY